MRVDDHPDAECERAYLERVHEAIRLWLERLPVDDKKIEDYATAILLNWSAQWRESIHELKTQPYFGRVDLVDGGSEEQLYIGRRGLRARDTNSQLVVDWRAPIAANFYRPSSGVVLKRRYDIREGRLLEIHDDIVAGPDGSPLFGDAGLLQVLEETRSGGLRAVVETIQSEQDELIRAEDKAIIIQGSAGTGKTIVALHRLAYLLYRDRTKRRSARATAAVFGPNRIFLNYASDVLPSLGETDIVQTTFEDWVGDWTVAYPALLSDAAPEEISSSRLKGSLAFGAVIDRYAARLHDEAGWRLTASPITIAADLGGHRGAVTLRIDASELVETHKMFADRPLNLARERVSERLWLRLRSNLDERYAIAKGDLEARAPAAVWTRAHKKFLSVFGERWSPVEPYVAYRALRSSPVTLQIDGDGLIQDYEVERLADGRLTRRDLPGLAYLASLINGTQRRTSGANASPPSTRFSHVVIDEAQDWTPLQFRLVQSHADNLTILGDLAQAIVPGTGIERWDDVVAALEGQLARQVTLTQSYRSTRQIMEMANAIRAKLGVEAPAAKPFPREGQPPQLWRADSSEEMFTEIATEIDWLAGTEFQSVAVICRTPDHASRVATSLVGSLERDLALILDEGDQIGPITVLPVHLAKGMDFDVVIVVDADEENYSRSELDGRLLYVALTRALHRLLVSWTGVVSPWLGGIADLETGAPPSNARSRVARGVVEAARHGAT